jgi:xyloglucan-specific exo-beta-1,4-glucanase
MIMHCLLISLFSGVLIFDSVSLMILSKLNKLPCCILPILVIYLAVSTVFLSCKKHEPDDNNPDTTGVGVPTLPGAYTWGSVAIGGGGFVTGIITCPSEKNLVYLRTDVGGAYRWIEETGSWKPITDFAGPDETSLLGIESIAVDPANPQKVYIAAGTEYWNSGLSCILISDNYGESFEKVDVTSMFKFHGNGMGRQNGERLAVDPNKEDIIFCGTRKNGLWKSNDGGHNWQNISTFPVISTTNGNGICFVTMDGSGGNAGSATQIVYVGVSRSGSNNLFVTHDGGNTWQPVTGAPTNRMPMRSLLADGKLYVSYADAEGPWNSSTGSLWRYNISSGDWTNITPEAGTAFSGISASNDGSMLIATSLNKWINQGPAWGDEIYTSTDDGSTWTRLFQEGASSTDPGEISWTAKASIHWAGDVQIDPYNKDRAWIISGNGVYITVNLTSGSPVWKNASAGLEETVPLDLVSIPGGPLASVIGDYDGFMHTDITQYPLTIHFPSVGTSTGIACAAQKPNFVVRCGGDENDRALYYTDDYGETWSRVLTTGMGKYRGHVAVSADGECILWSPSTGSATYYTLDLGQTWSECDGISGALYPASDYVNPNAFYAFSTSGKFYKSLDKGKTFTSTLTSFTGGSTIIRSVPGNEGQVLIAGKGQGLYITRNYGLIFEKIETVTYCEAVGTGKGPDESNYPSIYIYGEIVNNEVLAPYRSDDAGKTWVRINDDDHQFGDLANGQFIIGDMNVFGRVYRSTAGRGIVYGEKKE